MLYENVLSSSLVTHLLFQIPTQKEIHQVQVQLKSISLWTDILDHTKEEVPF